MTKQTFLTLSIGTIALALLVAAPALGGKSTADQDGAAPTFYKNILPILQDNCQTCHRPAGLNLGGMIAPMSFMSYQEVRPWAKSIARVVESREMPPWHAGAEYAGIFLNERTLSDDEIASVVRWARSGARAGDQADAPPSVEWTESEWAMGEPDLVISLAEPFHVKDDIEDLNINLSVDITPEMLPEDKYVVAMEYKPGSEVVHHIIGFTIQPGKNSRMDYKMLGGIAPGTEPAFFPEGYGVKLFAGSKFIFQMHYHKEPGAGTGVYDQSSVAFKFADTEVQPLHITAVGNPREMYLPANTKDVFITSSQEFEKPISIVSLLPHMHLRGVYSKYVAVLPNGTRQEFLEVPQYDFNWQTGYRFKDHLELPAGTTIEVTMGYDNTADNPGNPDPSIDVKWGDATTDEMNLGWMTWAYTDPADEDGTTPRPIGGFEDSGD